MANITVNVKFNDRKLNSMLNSLIDSKTMLEAHNLLAKRCDKYVPFLTGALSQTNIVTPHYVRYTQPYAVYQYYGTEFNHTLDFHPLASAMWDKKMMQLEGDAFKEELKRILIRRYKELYG